MTNRRVAPHVQAAADRLGVDVNDITPSGVGGRVSLADVHAAATKARPQQAPPPPVAVPSRVDMAPTRSPFGDGRTGMLNRYARNPFVEFAQGNYDALSPYGGQAPTMFSTGDLPPFTASGLDPQLLSLVPWQVRHAAALCPDRSQVLAVIEGIEEPDALQSSAGAAGLQDYANRVHQWALAPKPQPEMTEAEYLDVFPDEAGAAR